MSTTGPERSPPIAASIAAARRTAPSRSRSSGSQQKFSRTPGRMHRPPPHFAQHNRAVLGELGYTDAEIEGLIAAGVLVEPKQAAE